MITFSNSVICDIGVDSQEKTGVLKNKRRRKNAVETKVFLFKGFSQGAELHNGIILVVFMFVNSSI